MDSGLERLKQSLYSAVDGMSSEQLRRQPAGKWSAAEILEHLYLSYTGTIKGLERMLESGQPTATRPSLRQRARSFVVLGLNYLPNGREAPPMTRPKGLPPDKVKNDLGEKLAAMDSLLAQGETHFGRSAPVLEHPILGPLTARQWRKFHCIHGRHHHKQILRLRENMQVTHAK